MIVVFNNFGHYQQWEDYTYWKTITYRERIANLTYVHTAEDPKMFKYSYALKIPRTVKTQKHTQFISVKKYGKIVHQGNWDISNIFLSTYRVLFRSFVCT